MCLVCNGLGWVKAAPVVRRVAAEGEKDFVSWDHMTLTPCWGCEAVHSMICSCGHQDWHHLKVTYPARRNPCGVCVKCGGNGRTCCLIPSPCRCSDFTERKAS